MSGLHSALQDYLALRRAMGFKMERHAKLLGQFVDFLAAQDAATLTLEGGDQTPTPGKVTYKLDGSPSKNMIANRGGATSVEQVSRAMWAGNTIVVTTTRAGGEEKRTLSMEGGDLVVETSATTRSGGAPNVSKVIFKKRIRGYGG